MGSRPGQCHADIMGCLARVAAVDDFQGPATARFLVALQNFATSGLPLSAKPKHRE